MAKTMQEKSKSFLTKLNKLPNCNNEDFYQWADYIEFKCLFNQDGFYSTSDYVDNYKQRTEDLGEGDFDDCHDDQKNNTSNAEKNDKWETHAKDIFRVISNRINLFGDYYPFELTENHLAIKLKSELNLSNKMYIFLLFSSNLRYTLDFKKEFTSSFEFMSLEVLKKYLPADAEVKLFGSSNTESIDTENISKFWDKLLDLKTFIIQELKVKEDEIGKYNKGDGGLDLIAKIPSGDQLTHFPLCFAQCACSPEEWPAKQSSMHFNKWDNYITFSTMPLYFMFIPQSYRSSDGNWFDRTKIEKTILIDRKRILSKYGSDGKFKEYTSYAILEELIKLKESTF